VVCLHGWGGGPYWIEEHAFPIERWLARGLDVLLFQLPFHGRRAPRPAPGQIGGSGALFPSPDLQRTNEAFGQAIHDLRSLAAALRQRGAPALGAIGMSLGGYVTALWASLDGDLAFAVPIIPAVVMADLMWRQGGDGPTRRLAEQAGMDRDVVAAVLAVHAPLTRPVRLPDDRLLIVAGRGDRITGPAHAEALWHHWRHPDIVWFPGGHLAQFGRATAFRAVTDRLADLGLATPR
jgi:pimeloyl-ACP methyl ester carboxylesterase